MQAPSKLAFVFLWLFVLSFPTEKAIHVEGFGTVSRLLGIFALGAGVLAVAINGKIRMPLAAHGALAAFVLWSALTMRWSLDPEATGLKASTYLQLLGMVWLIWEFCPTQRRIHGVMQAYVLGTVFAAIDTIAHFARAHQTYYQRYAGGGFDPNDLALTLALGIPMSYYLALQSKPRVAWIYWLHISLIFAAVLLSASRTGFLASCAAFSIVPLTFSQLRTRAKLIIVVGAVALIIAAVALAPSSSWKRLSTIGTEVSAGSLNNRDVIWKEGLAAFRQHPFGGVGAGGYPRAVEPLFGWPTGWTIVAHNTFLSVLVETGIAGAVLFALFLAMLAAGIRNVRGQERSLWLVMLAVWFIGVNTLTWEIRKPTWLLFSLALTHPFVWRVSDGRATSHREEQTLRNDLQVVMP
jgi:O-antigen ligase